MQRKEKITTAINQLSFKYMSWLINANLDVISLGR